MDYVRILFVFGILWWVILLMVLPFGIERQKKVNKGNADGAPENPKLLFKFMITTILTIIATYFVVTILTPEYMQNKFGG